MASPSDEGAGQLPDEVPGLSFVGAKRRLRALAARSWSPEAVERATGIPAPLVRRGLDGSEITPEVAVVVASAYERLWDRDPPVAGREDREAAEDARSLAASRGWAPPMAWDDDQIDLPAGQPAAGWKLRCQTRRAVDLVEDAEFLKEHGGYRDATAREVAIRMGVSRERLDQAYIRARRYAARDAAPDADAEKEAEAG